MLTSHVPLRRFPKKLTFARGNAGFPRLLPKILTVAPRLAAPPGTSLATQFDLHAEP